MGRDLNIKPALGVPTTLLLPLWPPCGSQVGPAPKETAAWLQEACAARDVSLNSPDQWGQGWQPEACGIKTWVSDCLGQGFQPSSQPPPQNISFPGPQLGPGRGALAAGVFFPSLHPTHLRTSEPRFPPLDPVVGGHQASCESIMGKPRAKVTDPLIHAKGSVTLCYSSGEKRT